MMSSMEFSVTSADKDSKIVIKRYNNDGLLGLTIHYGTLSCSMNVPLKDIDKIVNTIKYYNGLNDDKDDGNS
jgi:hypothetical protein